jgi:hypothetical protein
VFVNTTAESFEGLAIGLDLRFRSFDDSDMKGHEYTTKILKKSVVLVSCPEYSLFIVHFIIEVSVIEMNA